MKPLPKSLHTVTVLVNLSRYITVIGYGYETALQLALEILGYMECEDTHHLKDAALRQLTKG